MCYAIANIPMFQILTQDREEEEGLVEDDYWCEEDELSKDARVKVHNPRN